VSLLGPQIKEADAKTIGDGIAGLASISESLRSGNLGKILGGK